MKPRLYVAALMSVAVLSAGDFWQEKDPSQWTNDDAKKLLTKSPWAKKVTPEMAGARGPTPPNMNGGMGGRGGGGGDMGGGDMGGDDMGGGGGGGRRGGGGGDMSGQMGRMTPSLPPVFIRWETAAPVRAAETHSEFPADAAAEIAKFAPDYYVITLTGLQSRPPGRGGREQRGGEAEGAPSGPRFRSVFLQCKGKEKVVPEKLMRINVPGGQILALLFSRKNSIAEADNEVLFEADVMFATIKTKFKLKDMNYRGKLEL